MHTYLTYQPGAEAPETQSTDDITLELLQEGVGGLIEALDISRDENGRRITLWLNEEGKMIGLTPAIALTDDDRVLDVVMGPVVFTAVDSEGESVGLNEDEIETIQRRIFDGPEVLLNVFGLRTLPFLNLTSE